MIAVLFAVAVLVPVLWGLERNHRRTHGSHPCRSPADDDR